VDSPSGTPLEISGAEESSPTVVLGTVFVDSSAHLLQYKDATNTLAGTMVAPIADPGADHQWNKYIPNTGVPVRSRPACTDLSDSGTGCAGTLPLASNTNPLIAGTAAPGTGTTFSRTDHVHPTDTTRAAAATTVNGHALTGNVTVSAADVGLKWECQPGLGDGLNVIPSGTYLQTTCKNNTGVTVTITGIQCFTDNSGTSTLKVTNGAGVDLLTSPTNPLTCTSAYAAGTQSSTTTIANGDFLKFTFVADGSSKQTSWNIAGSR
jgi:hypothetical protein